jgi:phosphoglycolate phosphatase-like HAD superfamily hydrolase
LTCCTTARRNAFGTICIGDEIRDIEAADAAGMDWVR